MRPVLALAILGLVLASSGLAQIQSLTTTYVGGNGQSGNMFDVSTAAPIVIQSFDINANPGTHTVEIYALPTGMSYLGNETNAAAWGTPIATATGVVATAAGVATPLNLAIGFPILPGQTQAFYVTISSGSTVAYTNGSVQGALFVTDGILSVFEGAGIAYPFAGTFTPRVWNGTIHYQIGGGNPSYQINSAEASFDMDGVQTNGFFAPRTQKCAGQPVTFNLNSSLVGNPFNAIISAAPLVPGGIPLPGGQLINVDWFHPTRLFFFGGTVPLFNQAFPGPVSAPLVTAGSTPSLGIQMFVLNPAVPASVSLSQASYLDMLAAGGGPTPGPTADDSLLSVNLRGLPVCAPGDIPFYGTMFSTMQVSSNGRVMFGAGSTSFAASSAQAIVDSPFVGAWADFNPGGLPAIQVGVNTAGEIQVDYGTTATPLPYFGGAGTSIFNVRFDVFSGIVILGNLPGIGQNTGQMWLGISGGSLVGATDPGAQIFAPGGSGSTINGTDMLYEVGLRGSLAAGSNEIWFIPNPFSNYDWITL